MCVLVPHWTPPFNCFQNLNIPALYKLTDFCMLIKAIEMHSMGLRCFHFASARHPTTFLPFSSLSTFPHAWAFSRFRIMTVSLLMSLTVGEMQDWQNRVPHRFGCCFCSSFYWRAKVWYGDSLLCNTLFCKGSKHFSKAPEVSSTASLLVRSWEEGRGRLSPGMTRAVRTSKQLPQAIGFCCMKEFKTTSL